jgi:RNase P/RNase MRP subunit p30
MLRGSYLLKYFESRLKANFDDIGDIKEKIKFCEILGIKNVILEPIASLNKIPLKIKEELRSSTRINLFYRVNLRPNNLNTFKKKIKTYNKFPDILSVETSIKEIQIHAARDSRVDIISFSDHNILKTLTQGVVSLIKQNNSFLEFSLMPIMVNNKSFQSKNFRNLYRFLQLASKLNVKYFISGNFDELFDLRHPRAMISICHSLLGMSLVKAKAAFNDNVQLLLKRVQKRQDKGLIEDGVRLIGGE